MAHLLVMPILRLGNGGGTTSHKFPATCFSASLPSFRCCQFLFPFSFLHLCAGSRSSEIIRASGSFGWALHLSLSSSPVLRLLSSILEPIGLRSGGVGQGSVLSGVGLALPALSVSGEPLSSTSSLCGDFSSSRNLAGFFFLLHSINFRFLLFAPSFLCLTALSPFPYLLYCLDDRCP